MPKEAQPADLFVLNPLIRHDKTRQSPPSSLKIAISELIRICTVTGPSLHPPSRPRRPPDRFLRQRVKKIIKICLTNITQCVIFRRMTHCVKNDCQKLKKRLDKHNAMRHI